MILNNSDRREEEKCPWECLRTRRNNVKTPFRSTSSVEHVYMYNLKPYNRRRKGEEKKKINKRGPSVTTRPDRIYESNAVINFPSEF